VYTESGEGRNRASLAFQWPMARACRFGVLKVGNRNRMNTRRHAEWNGVWALLWRSLVFVPYMLVAFVCIGGVWFSRWVLPFYGAILFYAEAWWQASAAFALWVLVVWVYRRFHLHRFLEPPPSLL
jgi:hypothetical protein